jgi:hypothetical protein
MKAKFGAIITDGRGKLGGKVFSKNHYGIYEKIKVTPTNPASPYSALIRANHKSIVLAWELLTDSDRYTWNAGTKNFPQKNTFGDTVYLSGFALFLKLNINRLLLNQSIINTCPAITKNTNISDASCEVREIDNTVMLTFSPPCPADFNYKVYASASLSPGISYSNKRFKLIAKLTSLDLSTFDLSTAYNTRFGNVGSLGKKVFFKIIPTEIATGHECEPFIFSTIILNSLTMLKAEFTYNAANLVNGNVITLIPSPGPGKVITVINGVIQLNVNTTPYTGTGLSVVLKYQGASGTTPFINTTTITRTFSTTVFGATTNNIVGDMSNLPITSTVIGTPSSGDSTIKVTIYYEIANTI